MQGLSPWIPSIKKYARARGLEVEGLTANVPMQQDEVFQHARWEDFVRPSVRNRTNADMLETFGVVPEDRRTYNVLLQDIIREYTSYHDLDHGLPYASLSEDVPAAVRKRTDDAVLKVFGSPMPKEDEYNQIVSDLLSEHFDSDSESDEEGSQRELLEHLQRAWDLRDAQRFADGSLSLSPEQCHDSLDTLCQTKTDDQRVRLTQSIQMIPVRPEWSPSYSIGADQDLVVMNIRQNENDFETLSGQSDAGSDSLEQTAVASSEELSFSRQEARPSIEYPLAISSERSERHARLRIPTRLSSRPGAADLSSLANRARSRHAQQDETSSDCTSAAVDELNLLSLVQQSRIIEPSQAHQHFALPRRRTTVADTSSLSPVFETVPGIQQDTVTRGEMETHATTVTPAPPSADRSDWSPFGAITMHGTPPRAQSHSLVRRTSSLSTRRLPPQPSRQLQLQYHFDDDEDLFPIEDIVVGHRGPSQIKISLTQQMWSDATEDSSPATSITRADVALSNFVEGVYASMSDPF